LKKSIIIEYGDVKHDQLQEEDLGYAILQLEMAMCGWDGSYNIWKKWPQALCAQTVVFNCSATRHYRVKKTYLGIG